MAEKIIDNRVDQGILWSQLKNRTGAFMKKFQTLLGTALCGVLLIVGLTASAQPNKPGYATVVRVQGFAQYSLDGTTWHPLIPGKFLDQGAWIHTGADGIVDVVLAKAIDLPQAKWVPERISLAVDSPVRGMMTYKPSAEQNIVRLLENTTLVIDKLTARSRYDDAVGDTELNLKNGSIYASVKKLNAADQYLVKTPTGIAGVKGTQFFLSLNADGTINTLAVYRVSDPVNGGVLLAPNGGATTILILAHQMWQPGDVNAVPVPAGLFKVLGLTFDAVRTIYIEVINFDFDHTLQYESSDFGF
jgi:hypothetical protein